MEIKDKVVVITGGSSGLGKALAKVFSKGGAKVVIVSNDPDELKETADELNVFSFEADITREEQVLKIGTALVERFKSLDIWINNAGIWLHHSPVEEMDLQRVHQLIEVNLFGTIHGSKTALLQMKKQGSGLIVNILSVSALEGRPESSGYCASKYAAAGFSKSLRLELVDDNIKVIDVYPGYMQTDLFNEKKPEGYDHFMKPSDVAAKILENIMSHKPKEEQIIKEL